MSATAVRLGQHAGHPVQHGGSDAGRSAVSRHFLPDSISPQSMARPGLTPVLLAGANAVRPSLDLQRKRVPASHVKEHRRDPDQRRRHVLGPGAHLLPEPLCPPLR